ncbi:MAG: hypothetical protein G01um10147_951 [Microgenomates group bacterium Gr01-1014_7]|nr:MAG: hypothetical protein G01um10147_951 [Microgenomates group bacterium Gr01-1014_7]
MDIHKKYLILDEERNAIDYLNRAVEFLEKIDIDFVYLKWFTIAFHGAVYSFVLLVLQEIHSDQIYQDKKTSSHPLERELISFKAAYELLKTNESTMDDPYNPTGDQDICVKEINDQIRNQMMHFRPTVWASEPWYFARASYPLLDVLKFCIDKYRFKDLGKEVALRNLAKIEKILARHIK